MRRTGVLAAISVIAAGGLVGLTPGASQASSQTFNADGSYAVPAGITSVHVVVTGAGGGTGRDDGTDTLNSVGGVGGIATATITVTPGATLSVLVGGRGGDSLTPGTAGTGGTNGGAAGGDYGGGGGGRSEVAQGATKLVVAGGGGGGGGEQGPPHVGGVGGAGGGLTGGIGANGSDAALSGGGGGSQAVGGAAGGAGAAAGTSGFGGAANFGGGGGGGGYWGGGGGWAPSQSGGGGGGGSGFINAAYATGSFSAASTRAAGVVTITPISTPSANPGTILPANAKIKRNGTTKVTSANAKTSTGQRIRTRVKCQQRTRGDIRLCKVIHKNNGATYVKTYGIPLKITITWYAPATATSKAYKKVRTYKT